MTNSSRSLRIVPVLAAFILLATPALLAQATESSINKQIKGLHDVAEPQRPAATIKIATDIRTLPAGPAKVKLADSLFHLATAGDIGNDALQAVADALAQALTESPQPLAKDGRPAMPYMDLAKLARYEQISTNLKDPMFTQADQLLATYDAEIEKADFTLKDLDNKKATLSELHGKIVLVSFWATTCNTCLKEMSDLDPIYTHYKSQGLVILSITDEDSFKAYSFLRELNYHPTVLIDPGSKVTKQFHVESIPKIFVFDRDGKLVAQSIDMRTQKQLFAMLAKAGLRP